MLVAAWCLLCLAAWPLAGQKPSSARVGVNRTGAPVPDPLLIGKRAFVSYELGDVTDFPSGYSGGPERAYSEFYGQMKQWGHYELVSDPKDADLVFAIRFVNPPGVLPQIRLGVVDGHGHVSLWGFVEQVDVAFHKRNRDADFTDAVTRLVTDVKNLVERIPAAAQNP